MPATYNYEHVTSFEESNVVGNIYFSHFARWQGRCRELFLKDHAPAVLTELEHSLALFTVRCSCEFLLEVRPLSVVVIEMSLLRLFQTRLVLGFEYWQDREGQRLLVARGEQEIVCVARGGPELRPTAVPAALREALRPFER
jgi:enediyne biosynthesis thioesterase